MTAPAWIALAFGAATLLMNLITLAIGYGILRGTVSAIDARVKSLEAETRTIRSLEIAMGEIKADVRFVKEGVAEIKIAIDQLAPRRRTGA